MSNKKNITSLLLSFILLSLFSIHSFANEIITGSEILAVEKGGTPNIVYKENKPRIKIATYNIGKNEASNNVSDFTTLNTAIKKIAADIIIVVEIDNKTKRSNNIDQLKKLADANNLFYRFGKAIDFDGGEYGVGILSKYVIQKSQVIKLDSGNAEQRIVLVSEINHPNFDSPIIVMATHLDWQTAPDIRLKQVRNIIDISVGNIASEFSNLPTAIKIVAGDFNATRNDESVNELEKYYNIAQIDNVDYRTWPAINPAIDIDHIFTFKGQRWNVLKSYVLADSDDFKWSSASDHLPNIVELELKEQ